MAISCSEVIEQHVYRITKKFNIEAKIIGQCEKSPTKDKNIVEIKSEFGSFIYD